MAIDQILLSTMKGVIALAEIPFRTSEVSESTIYAPSLVDIQQLT